MKTTLKVIGKLLSGTRDKVTAPSLGLVEKNDNSKKKQTEQKLWQVARTCVELAPEGRGDLPDRTGRRGAFLLLLFFLQEGC